MKIPVNLDHYRVQLRRFHETQTHPDKLEAWIDRMKPYEEICPFIGQMVVTHLRAREKHNILLRSGDPTTPQFFPKINWNAFVQ